MVVQEYCPLSGNYVFTYSVNDGLLDLNVAENVNECHEPVSELSNCPTGYGLNLRFKRCSFGELGELRHCESFISLGCGFCRRYFYKEKRCPLYFLSLFLQSAQTIVVDIRVV